MGKKEHIVHRHFTKKKTSQIDSPAMYNKEPIVHRHFTKLPQIASPANTNFKYKKWVPLRSLKMFKNSGPGWARQICFK